MPVGTTNARQRKEIFEQGATLDEINVNTEDQQKAQRSQLAILEELLEVNREILHSIKVIGNII